MRRLILTSVLFFSATSFAGPGEAGGGGSTIRLNGKTELLDIYIFKKQHPGYQVPESPRGITLPTTRALSYVHLEKITSLKATNDLQNKRLLPVQIALERLKLWDPTPPPFIKTLKDSLEKAPIYYMDYRWAGKTNSYWIPEALQAEITPDMIHTTSLYVKDMGMLISKKDLEELDLTNQVGLVIHEALRHMQHSLGMNISNEDIEIVTGNVVFGLPFLPKGVENLATENVTMQNQAIKDFNETRDMACAMITRAPYPAKFADAKDMVCNTPSFEPGMTSEVNDQRVDSLIRGLDVAIVRAAELVNDGKMNSDMVNKLSHLRTRVYVADENYTLYSEELDEALNVLRNATIGLNHFAFDSVITMLDQGRSHPYAADLRALMEGFRKQGYLQ